MKETALLLMNLGSPASPAKKDLKPYLTEFLMDERVIDVPAWWRSILVKGIIVPFRAAKSAAAYRSIWTKEGSPLIVWTNRLKESVAQQTGLPVETCMRYGFPSPAVALDRIRDNHPGIKEVILVPLYPHYAWSSYETAVEYVKLHYSKGNYPFALRIVPPFYKDEKYISALAGSIAPYLDQEYDLLVFSYHGIPERHITKRHPAGSHNVSDPAYCCTDASLQETCYRHQVITTTRLVAEKLGIAKDKYTLSFQSRLGRDPWLQPYTARQLELWPKQGYKKLLMVCPAFVSDCLETLEEIGVEGKKSFLGSGGEHFELIPCMNTDPGWVKALVEITGSAG